MGKAFKILLIGLGIWAGLEIYLEGPQNAFGGIFASHQAESGAPRDTRTTPQRAGDSVKHSREMEVERNERLMED
ncbi:MAG TPA: hypothetical protein VII72_18475 [Myxococcota bacterium]|jgi:hypothetical protein